MKADALRICNAGSPGVIYAYYVSHAQDTFASRAAVCLTSRGAGTTIAIKKDF